MSKKPTRLTAQVVMESHDGNSGLLRRHVIAAVKSSCRNTSRGAVCIAIHDADGTLLGLDVVGTPSEEMQQLIDEVLSGDTED